MAKEERNWHPNFKKYMEKIIQHPNYTGMPEIHKKDGSILWITAGKGRIGKERTKWWDKKREELGIDKKIKWISETAKKNHPTGRKPCQICGEEMELAYVYPYVGVLAKINAIPKINGFFDVYYSINDIIKEGAKLGGEEFFKELRKIFKIPAKVKDSVEAFQSYITENCKTKLSPGAMSNAPDRLDGFHTYNKCCRATHDTGRHKSNLQRYVQDRRAYENWAEGDWKAAERLMGEFHKHGLSADHIGPISLGFCHRAKFQPMSREANSAKNNRMSLNDVQILLADEAKGQKVVSWHSKFVWDALKSRVKTDAQAKLVSRLMRKNLHHVLSIFAKINAEDGKEFLIRNFLHPEHSYYDVKFTGFNPETGGFEKMKKIEGDKKQYKNNVQRYIRISFESLGHYIDKDNRVVSSWNNLKVDEVLSKAVASLKAGNEDTCKENLSNTLKLLAEDAVKEFESEQV